MDTKEEILVNNGDILEKHIKTHLSLRQGDMGNAISCLTNIADGRNEVFKLSPRLRLVRLNTYRRYELDTYNISER
jgi:hypothetical protein